MDRFLTRHVEIKVDIGAKVRYKLRKLPMFVIFVTTSIANAETKRIKTVTLN